MVKLNIIVNFLNRELKIKSIKDESLNGLQVRASNEIRKVGLATDACMDAFVKAKKLKCDLLIVHHGIFWKDGKHSKNLIKMRVSFLKKNNMSLYAAHLPLDKHFKYGNNSNILRMLDVEPKEIFGGIGYIGYLKIPKNINSIKKEVEAKLKTRCIVWRLGKDRIKKLAVVSGYGAGEISKAVENNVDLFIVGEASHGSYLRAKDEKLSMILAGHYKTETVGVKEVGKLLEKKFDVKTIFIDNPTGM